MIKLTASVEKGVANLKHNFDKSYRNTLEHTNSNNNIILENTPIRQVYHELFDKSLEKYNLKQTRNDRKINNYYDYIQGNCIKTLEKAKNNNNKSSNAVQPFNEIIITCGNCVDNPDIKDLQIKLLTNIYDELKAEFPQFRFFGATIHLDEASPHLHADFVPFAINQSRGLETKVAFDKSLEQMGIKREKALINNTYIGNDGKLHEKQPTLFNGFRNKVNKIIENVYAKYDVELIQANQDTALKIKNINDFKLQKSIQDTAIQELINNPNDKIKKDVVMKIVENIPEEEVENIENQQKDLYKTALISDENFKKTVEKNLIDTINQNNQYLQKINNQLNYNITENQKVLERRKLLATSDEKELLENNNILYQENITLKNQIRKQNSIIDTLKNIILNIFINTSNKIHFIIHNALDNELDYTSSDDEYNLISNMQNDLYNIEEQEEEN